MFTTKYMARKFINQPAKLLYEAAYEDLPHGTRQVVMWHLLRLVPHQVLSLLWHQHLTLPALHLSRRH